MKIAKCCHVCNEICREGSNTIGVKYCSRLKKKIHSLQCCELFNVNTEQVAKINITITKKC